MTTVSNQLALLAPTPWANPAPLLTSDREQFWSFKLLNVRDVEVRELDGVKACTVRFNAGAEIRGGGSLTYVGEPIDWMAHRIQPWIHVRGAEGEVSWPLGVFIPEVTDTQHGDPHEPVQMDLYDKTLLLVRNDADTGYSMPAGESIVKRVRHIMEHNSLVPHVVSDSTATSRSSRVWDWGTPLIRLVNDLLDSINYFSVYTDSHGVFRADPYVRPQDRAPAFSFVDDSNSIYSPEFTHGRDQHKVPNKVSLVSATEGDERPMIARAFITDPNSNLHWTKRGGHFTHYEDGVAAPNQAALDAMAQRRLDELTRVTSTYQISHLPVPMALNDAVIFRRDELGMSALTTVHAFELSMGSDLCSTTLREVASR